MAVHRTPIGPDRQRALLPAERVQAERLRAREERLLAARQRHLAFLYGGPLEATRLRSAELHRAAAAVHDGTADRIERCLTDRRSGQPQHVHASARGTGHKTLVQPPLIEGGETGDVVVKPLGDLDLAGGPVLVEAISQAISQAPRRLVIDLGSVTFLDASGCGALLTGLREARLFGVRIGLRGEMIPIVRRVLEITMLVSIFDPA